MMKVVRCLAVALLLGAVTGCHDKVVDQNGVAITYQVWVPLLILAAGAVAIPLGIVLIRKKKYTWGIVLGVLGPIVAIVVAPGMFSERVEVNNEGLYSKHGLWFSPKEHSVRYDQLAMVKITEEVSTGRRGRKNYSYYFDCTLKNGTQERIPLGDLMKEMIPEIATQFKKHQVAVFIPNDIK